jgi:hypothetical protein
MSGLEAIVLMKLRDKQLANPRNHCRGFSQIRVQGLATSLIRSEARAGYETAVMSKNQLLEKVHHGIAQSAELQLSDTQSVRRPLADHGAGNLERLR